MVASGLGWCGAVAARSGSGFGFVGKQLRYRIL